MYIGTIRSLVLIAIFLASLGVSARDGLLDPTFGNCCPADSASLGRVVIPIPVGTGVAEAIGAVELADGSLIVVGSVNLSNSAQSNQKAVTLVKLTPDGLPDPHFYDNGVMVVPFAHLQVERVVQALARRNAQSGDVEKIVVLTTQNRGGANTDPLVLQFNIDGSFDIAFNDGAALAYVPFDFLSEADDDQAAAMALQSDGKLVVLATMRGFVVETAFALARLEVSGHFDVSFGSLVNYSGYTYEYIEGADANISTALAIKSSDVIVAGGVGESDAPRATLYAVMSLGPRGIGVTHHVVGCSNDNRLTSLAVDLDGNVLVAGSFLGSTKRQEPCNLRLREEVFSPLSTVSERPVVFFGDLSPQAISVLPDGKILIAYTGCNGLDCDFLLQRQPIDGTFGDMPDGTGALVFFDQGADNQDALRAMIPLSDSRALLVGRAQTSVNTFAFAVARLIVREEEPPEEEQPIFRNGFEGAMPNADRALP